uniref:Uncharacterized protein n=1 Tax=Anguilla anguilla TaxID=7936 RepID=A0A0E9QR09_ANGAN
MCVCVSGQNQRRGRMRTCSEVTGFHRGLISYFHE